MTHNGHKNALFAGMLICIATLLAYRNVIYNGFVSYDDIDYLISNDHVRPGLTADGFRWALTATYDGNWFPLTWLSHMADMSIFGPNPIGHHLVSLSLHISNALLLLWILVRMTGSVWRSAAVAALFALHPLHVESVAWAAERKDVLSTLFFMLTISAYLGYCAKQTALRYLSVIGLYACGLAAKPMLVSLPLVLLLLDAWPLCRLNGENTGRNTTAGKPLPSLLVEKIPLAILSAASCVITVIVQRQGGAMADTGGDAIGTNAAHAAVSYVRYLYKIFWPADLAFLYPYVDKLPTWQVIGAVVLLLLITVTAVRQWQKRPYCAIGWFWFLITLVPVIGFIRVGSLSMADRYTYIPSIGIYILLVWLTAGIIEENRWRNLIAMVLATLFLFPLCITTATQTGYWKDSITLFEHAISTTRDNWVAHNNMAAERIKQGMYRQALWHAEEAIRVNPFHTYSYINLGGALSGLDDMPGAIGAYKDALLHQPQPRFVAEVYYKLGRAYSNAGDMKQAFETCGILQQFDPAMADLLNRSLIIAEQIQGHPAAHNSAGTRAITK